MKSFPKFLRKNISRFVNHIAINKFLYHHQYGLSKNNYSEHNLPHWNKLNFAITQCSTFHSRRFPGFIKGFPMFLTTEYYWKNSPKWHHWQYSWMISQLSVCKSQIVDINGSVSYPKPVYMSVIQGSLPGPTLFLIYINNLPTCTEHLWSLYAEDNSAVKAA